MAIKVLAVDDEAGFTKLVKMNLERDKEFEVRVENSSNKALSAALEFKPDVILLDVVMPGMDGGDVLTQVKKNAALANIPVVFMTALMAPREVGEKGFQMSPTGIVLPKPVNLDTLKKTLRDAANGEPVE